MSRIVSTGAYLPQNIIKNEFFLSSEETGDEAPIMNFITGLDERRHAEKSETGLYMGVMAAKQALSRSEYSPEEIDLVIGMIQPNQYLYPEDLFLLARETGCVNAISIPVNTACSSFLTALNIANVMISSGSKKRVLIAISANWVRYGLDKTKDYSFAGDGAGAVVLDDADDGLVGIKEKTDFRVFHTMCIKSPLVTNKNEHFEVAADPHLDMVDEQIEQPVSVAKELLAENAGISVDWFIAHQAGIAMLEVWRRRLGIPKSKLKHTFDKYANMSVANLPVTLDYFITRGDIKRGDILLLFTPATGAHYISILWRF